MILPLIFLPHWALYARPSASALAVPTFRDDGDKSEPFALRVGSSSATSLYDGTTSSMTAIKVRSVLIQNPSVNYQLYIGTCPNFMSLNSPKFVVVHKSSGSYTTFNHSDRWLQYPPGSSSDTVRGEFEYSE